MFHLYVFVVHDLLELNLCVLQIRNDKLDNTSVYTTLNYIIK